MLWLQGRGACLRPNAFMNRCMCFCARRVLKHMHCLMYASTIFALQQAPLKPCVVQKKQSATSKQAKSEPDGPSEVADLQGFWQPCKYRAFCHHSQQSKAQAGHTRAITLPTRECAPRVTPHKPSHHCLLQCQFVHIPPCPRHGQLHLL